MKKFFGACLLLLFSLAGCTLFEAPEGTAELSESSVHTRTERPTASEEVVYCSADVKISNTSDKTIYGCTVTAVATSDTGIEHYVTLSYDVNIPPYQSIYVTIEWSLVRQIDTKTKVVSETSSHIPGSSVTSSTSSSSSSTSTTSTTASVTDSNEEKDWNKSSVRIVDYFFN